MKQTLIGGVGSVLLGDDGVGPYAVQLLESAYEFDSNVRVEDLGTPGLDLIAHLSAMDVLILIDSVENGAVPGTVSLYRRSDIMRAAPQAVRVDPHSSALAESLMIADFTGQGAAEVLLIGITGENYEPNRAITPAARQGAEQAVQETLRELDRLGVYYRKKAEPSAIKVWWEPLGHELESLKGNLEL